MRRTLQTLIVVVGLAVLAFLLWEPTVEGRNAHATLTEIYFGDPFLAWAYGASVFFFVALAQGFRLVGDPRSLKAVRLIRYCAIVLIGFAVAAIAYLNIVVRGTDDIAGGVFMANLIILISAAMAGAAMVWERKLRAS